MINWPDNRTSARPRRAVPSARRSRENRLHVLTLYPIWADAVIFGPKRVENRSWKTEYRGPLAIQAGATRKGEPAARKLLLKAGYNPPDDPATGVILGLVDLVDVVAYDRQQAELFADFFDEHGLRKDVLAVGPWCWILANPRPLAKPVPCRGRQRLFTVAGQTALDVMDLAGDPET